MNSQSFYGKFFRVRAYRIMIIKKVSIWDGLFTPLIMPFLRCPSTIAL